MTSSELDFYYLVVMATAKGCKERWHMESGRAKRVARKVQDDSPMMAPLSAMTASPSMIAGLFPKLDQSTVTNSIRSKGVATTTEK
jgi:hypothetical protein